MVAAGPNVFLTYSNGALLFEENAAAFCDAARHAGFDQAIHYRQSDLPEAFRVENEAILTQARGAGYWLWKPFIILETLSKLPPGAALVYSDAGRGLAGTMTFFDGLPSVLLAIARASPQGFLAGFSNDWATQARFTKPDCLVLMDAVTPEMLNAPQITATWSVWTPTEAAVQFLREWLQWARDPRVLTDQPDEAGRAPEWDFQDHRHDQAICSILAHRHRAAYLALHRSAHKPVIQAARDQAENRADIVKKIASVDALAAACGGSLLLDVPGPDGLAACADLVANVLPGEPIPDLSAVRRGGYPAQRVQALMELVAAHEFQQLDWWQVWAAARGPHRKLFKAAIDGLRRPSVDTARRDVLGRARSALALAADLGPLDLQDVKKIIDRQIREFAGDMGEELTPDGWATLSAVMPTDQRTIWRSVFGTLTPRAGTELRHELGAQFMEAEGGDDPDARYSAVEAVLHRRLLQAVNAQGPDSGLAQWFQLWTAMTPKQRHTWRRQIGGLRMHEVNALQDFLTARVLGGNDADLTSEQITVLVDCSMNDLSEFRQKIAA